MISFSVLLRFDFLFGGANRYIPFRVIMALLFFWFVISLFIKSTASFTHKLSWFYILGFIGFFIFAHFFWLDKLDNTSDFIRNQLHFIYILSGFFLTYYLQMELSKTQINRLVKACILGVIVVVGIETFFRFFFPTLDLNSESTDYLIEIYQGAQGGLSFDTFYFFKMSSIMFFDSNYVGAFLIIFLGLNMLVNYDSKFWRLASFTIIYFLIILTLSRAAIVVSAGMGLYFVWNKWSSYSKWLTVFLSIGISILVLFFIQDQVQFQDGSFLTKLQILEGLNGFFDQEIATALMGLGYEVGGYLYSYMSGGYAHIHFAILLGELGLLGLLVYLSFWYVMGLISGSRVLFLFIPFLIIGFSLADPWEIAYFWACGIIHKI